MTYVKNAIRRSDEEMWYWYEMTLKYKESYLTKPQFCIENKLDPKKFQNMYYRFIYKQEGDPEEHARHVDIAKRFMLSGDRLKDFAKKHKISESQLAACITHLSYMKVIERIKEAKQPKSDVPSGFIEVPGALPSLNYAPTQMMPALPNQQPEIVEKKNDIELIICKGVRVIISTELEPLKMIKIIELLQEL